MPVRANFTPFNLLAERLAEIHGLAVKVGCVGPKAGEREDGSDLTLAELWQIHEYGTEDGHIPERAPLRRAMMANRDEIAKTYRQVAYGLLNGKLSAEQACGLLGEKVAALVKATIIAGLSPPNAASTIKQKGSSTPLVDDGQFVNAVTYDVVGAAGEAAAPAAAGVAA